MRVPVEPQRIERSPFVGINSRSLFDDEANDRLERLPVRLFYDVCVHASFALPDPEDLYLMLAPEFAGTTQIFRMRQVLEAL